MCQARGRGAGVVPLGGSGIQGVLVVGAGWQGVAGGTRGSGYLSTDVEMFQYFNDWYVVLVLRNGIFPAISVNKGCHSHQ